MRKLVLFALLFSISFSNFGCGKFKAKMQNQNQLRRIAVTLLDYCEENCNDYPKPANQWCDLLEKNFVTPFEVDVADYGNAINNWKITYATPPATSFAINPNINSNSLAKTVVAFQIPTPAWNQYGTLELLKTNTEGANVLFNDGHVEFVEPEEYDKLYFGKSDQDIISETKNTSVYIEGKDLGIVVNDVFKNVCCLAVKWDVYRNESCIRVIEGTGYFNSTNKGLDKFLVLLNELYKQVLEEMTEENITYIALEYETRIRELELIIDYHGVDLISLGAAEEIKDLKSKATFFSKRPQKGYDINLNDWKVGNRYGPHLFFSKEKYIENVASRFAKDEERINSILSEMPNVNCLRYYRLENERFGRFVLGHDDTQEKGNQIFLSKHVEPWLTLGFNIDFELDDFKKLKDYCIQQ